MTDSLLSLKLVNHVPISAVEFFSLLGPQITKINKPANAEIFTEVQYILETIPIEQKLQWINSWSKETTKYRYQVASGFAQGYSLTTKFVKIDGYMFCISKEAAHVIKKVVREAENTYRQKRNFPRVGEGWVSETQLYYQIKEAFPQYEVIQHSSPNWLGKQHIDIFIPEISLGIEYQGKQHFEPVEFFGGEKSYYENKKRDKKKLNKCKNNGVLLLYVNEEDKILDVIEKIQRHSQTDPLSKFNCLET